MSSGFSSFEDALAYVSKPTHYEEQHDIRVLQHEPILSTQDMKIIKVYKTDASATIFIFMKSSVFHDKWMFWCPSQKQIDALPVVHKICYLNEADNVVSRK